jgi:hypothetical protein
MATSYTHCPNCGAEIKRKDSTICAMCAFPLLEKGPAEAKSTSASAERFEALKQHKNFRILLQRVPGRVDPRTDGTQLVVIGVALVPIGLLAALIVHGWTGLGVAAVGVALWILGGRKRGKIQRAPVEKRAAMLASEPSGGHVVPVTFEFGDGASETYTALAGAVVEGPRGSMGVAYIRRGELEEFRRVDV